MGELFAVIEQFFMNLWDIVCEWTYTFVQWFFDEVVLLLAGQWMGDIDFADIMTKWSETEAFWQGILLTVEPWDKVYPIYDTVNISIGAIGIIMAIRIFRFIVSTFIPTVG